MRRHSFSRRLGRKIRMTLIALLVIGGVVTYPTVKEHFSMRSCLNTGGVWDHQRCLYSRLNLPH